MFKTNLSARCSIDFRYNRNIRRKLIIFYEILLASIMYTPCTTQFLIRRKLVVYYEINLLKLRKYTF